MIYLNMPVGEGYGWAVCGKNLLKELVRLSPVRYAPGIFGAQYRNEETQRLVDRYLTTDRGKVHGTVIHTLQHSMEPSCDLWGDRNIGYLFYEDEKLTEGQVNALKRYDVVVAGSGWLNNVLYRHDIPSRTIIQGVDRSIFFSRPHKRTDEFRIFSGGKWEPRKAQDLVIEVMRRLKGIPAVLHYNWYNVFDPDTCDAEIAKALKGVSSKRIGLVPQEVLSEKMGDTDMGVFLNRCEGGTNLVLMEYLSTGRSAVVNISTGQRDVVRPEYVFCAVGNDDELVQKTVADIQWAYRNPEAYGDMCKKSAAAMIAHTWKRAAEKFVEMAESK